MPLKGKVISLAYALVLLACAFFAKRNTFAIGFAMGDGEAQAGLAGGAFLIGTLAGGAGLVIAALGAWTRRPGMSLLAVISVLIVLPSAVLYCWLAVPAYWINTQRGMHYGLWAWASAILPPFLGLVAAGLSWVRFRRLSSLVVSDTMAR
jgi:hypothetical protein